MMVRAVVTSMLQSASVITRGSRLLQRCPDPDADGPYKIFVVGSGRSGTHWVAHILEAYPSIHVTVEKSPTFPWVVEMAQRPETEARLFSKLARRCRAEHRAVLPRHYADKHHPNLWLAERLAAEFPEGRFIAIYRQLEGTVASMIKHGGVRRWIEIWDDDPRPNRFLGVSESLMPAYRDMSIPARCAVRVIAHFSEIERLKGVLGRKLHVIRYEDLHAAPEAEFGRISAFLRLETPTVVPMPNRESRTKWQSQLSQSDRADICAVAELLEASDLLEVPKAA